MFLGSASHTLRRPTPGSYVDGEWVAGVYVESTVVASVQPLTGDELQQLPEGQRDRLVRKAYTATELRTADIDARTGPDLLVVDGVSFEVHNVQHHTHVIPHYRVILVAQDEADG